MTSGDGLLHRQWGVFSFVEDAELSVCDDNDLMSGEPLFELFFDSMELRIADTNSRIHFVNNDVTWFEAESLDFGDNY